MILTEFLVVLYADHVRFYPRHHTDVRWWKVKEEEGEEEGVGEGREALNVEVLPVLKKAELSSQLGRFGRFGTNCGARHELKTVFYVSSRMCSTILCYYVQMH